MSDKKKEDFLIHELILLHTDNQIKEKEERKKMIKKEKTKQRSSELEKLLINFLKKNYENSYTSNNIKRELNYRGRHKTMTDELKKFSF